MKARSTSSAAVVVVATLLLITGCGSSHYPEPQVKTAVGRPGRCESCGKAIELVAEEHLVKVGASCFVVCDERCDAALNREMSGQ